MKKKSKNSGEPKGDKAKLPLRRKRGVMVMGVPFNFILFLACGFAVALVLVQLFLPQVIMFTGSQNMMLATVAGALVFLALAGVAVQQTYQKALKLRKANERLGLRNRALREEVDKEKLLNKTLYQKENKNREIIDTIKDIIFEADERGRIVFLNLAWTTITGFDIEQSVGQSIFSIIHQDDQAELRHEFEELLKGRKDRYRSFTQLRNADGTFGAVEVSLSMIAKGRDGEARFAGTMTDIEERRKAERALAEAEKKYRNIVQNAAGGIYQITPEGLYLSANPAFARILGFASPEKLLREVKNANESLYPDKEQRQWFINKLSMTPDVIQHEAQMLRSDGRAIWVNESARAVRDDTGQLLFIEGSIEDITERKESELKIHEAKMQSDMANRAKSEFLSNMSHELRTPLNSIIGFSEMIKNEVFGPVGEAAYWEYAKDIYESGQGLLRVINEILDISRIEAGERQLNEDMVNMRETVYECIGLMEHKIENNNLILTVSMDHAPNIYGEQLAIKQIVMNLLSNAVKFTPADGRITLTNRIDGEGRFHLSVTDTGVGLDDDGIQKALSPFGQVNSELSRSGSGTGLGLTLVDSLMKLHGGEFELFSQKGIGTTATLIFPKKRVSERETVVPGEAGGARESSWIGQGAKNVGGQNGDEPSSS